MKLKDLITVVCLFTYYFSLSQTPYYDALKLKDYSKISENKVSLSAVEPEVYSLLSIYFPNANSNEDIDLGQNPFLKFGSTIESDDDLIKPQFTTPSISGFNATNIADGLAKFLVKRTKEELNVAFFRKFKDILENYPEFEVLFPKTHNFVFFIEEQNYASMLQVLKEAFEDDMKTLVGNIPKLRNINCNCKHKNEKEKEKEKEKLCKCERRIEKITEFFKKEGGWTVWTASIFVDELINGKNPADALSSVFKDTDLKKIDIDDKGNPTDSIPLTYNVLKLIDLFSTSLRYKDDSQIWVSSRDIKKEIIENEIQMKIYLGLLYQQSKTRELRFPSKDSSPIYFHKILEKTKESQDEITYFLLELSESISMIEASLSELKKLRLENKSLNVRTVDNYLKGVNGLFEATLEFLEIVNETDSTLTPILKDVKKLTSTMEYGLSIYSDIEEKNYGSLIFNVTILLDSYMKNDEFVFKAELIKYGTFMATVAQAENSDQVAMAIEAAALPSGSSSVKRKSSFNVSLNAYVGWFGGSEKIVESGEESFVTGLTSPVGVAVSWGRLDFGIIQGFTLFASIIDIGAITTYRFDDDNDAKDLPELSFENIIAPGIHGYINFRNSPLSLGGGYQLGPSTREINGVDESIRRWHITLAIDIPLMNFYTKSK